MDNPNDFVPEFDGSPVVWCDQLNHFFGTGENRKQVLYDVRLRVWPGELVIMTGPSGSGKNHSVDADRRIAFGSGWKAERLNSAIDGALPRRFGRRPQRDRLHLSGAQSL